MKTPNGLIEIVAVDRTQDFIIVDFSDDTTMTMTTAELIAVRPVRTNVQKRDPEFLLRCV